MDNSDCTGRKNPPVQSETENLSADYADYTDYRQLPEMFSACQDKFKNYYSANSAEICYGLLVLLYAFEIFRPHLSDNLCNLWIILTAFHKNHVKVY